MRGRKPKPTKVKELNGNPGRRPLNEDEPTPPPGVPDRPPHLQGVALVCWDELVAMLGPMDLLTRDNGRALSNLCEAWGECVAASKHIAKHGRVLTRDKSGDLYPNPAIAMQRTAWRAFKDYCALFGLDPSSRTRLKVLGEKASAEEEDDDRFFGPRLATS